MTNLETNLALTQSKLNAATVTNSSLLQEKERLLTTKELQEENLHSLNHKYDALAQKLREVEREERGGIEAKTKLQDRIQTFENQYVWHSFDNRAAIKKL